MSGWNIKDKEWIKARKLEWALIQQNLEQTTIKKGDIKELKRYFLKGEEPYELPLLFRLWFHPNRSEQHWQQLRHAATPSEYQASCAFFIFYAVSPSYQNEAMQEYGFMGGIEDRVYHLLFDGIKRGDTLQFTNPIRETQIKTLEASSVLPSFAVITNSLLAYIFTDRLNPYSPAHLLVEPWYEEALQIDEKAFSSDPNKPYKLKNFLITVHYKFSGSNALQVKLNARYEGETWDSPPTEKQLNTAKALFKLLEERSLPPTLKTLWEEVKQEAVES